ncbi:ribbon-helix-helix domain-containing protein [Nitrobacter sp. JJSN]|uniref:ribbon-helix-helix domain-containing protein n=1 Tax=Nitrobacter sp. JJSN TaxID=3453033 RepID=UPI003F76B7BB
MLGNLIADLGVGVAADVSVKPAPEPAPIVAETMAPEPGSIRAASSVVTLTEKKKPEAPEKGTTLKKRAKQQSLYLEPEVYERLREIAFAERKPMHDLFLEGIDAVLKRRGAPLIKQLVKKAG